MIPMIKKNVYSKHKNEINLIIMFEFKMRGK